jgi:hypothetical protein
VGRLQRLVRKYRATSIAKLLDVSDGSSLGFAGKNFYVQFLAANLVEAYKFELFSELENPEEQAELAFEEVTGFPHRFLQVY